mgnify:FL=1
MTFADTLKGTKEGSEKIIDIDDPSLVDEIGADKKAQLDDEIELLDGASAEFDMELVTKGELSPVFFGSALTNFGVETFLQHFLHNIRHVCQLMIIDCLLCLFHFQTWFKVFQFFFKIYHTFIPFFI